MMMRPRTLVRWLALLGLSVLATIVAVMVQPSIRPPRWDLFACLAVAGVAATAGVLWLRRRPVDDSGGGPRWWADQRNGWVGFLAWFWLVPAFLVAYATLSPTLAAWQIVDAGSALRTTRIEKVLSTKHVSSQRTGHYTSTVRVSVPFDQGPKTSETEMTSTDKPRVGETVWALFAPSSPELGFFIGDRQSLEEKTGGRADFWTIFGVLGYLVFCWLMNLSGRWRADPVSGLHRSRQQGTLHALPVSVTGVGVARDERPPSGSSTTHAQPRIRLRQADLGELHLYLDDLLDPVPLADLLTRAQGQIYWRRPTRRLPYADSVGYAVLVLDDQRYVVGWLESADASVPLPQSARVSSDGALPMIGESRAIHPTSPVEASANATVLSGLLIGIGALAVVSFGIGDIATVVLAIVSVSAVLVGRRRATAHRGALREGSEEETAAVLRGLGVPSGRQPIVRETPRPPLPPYDGCSAVHSEVEWVRVSAAP